MDPVKKNGSCVIQLSSTTVGFFFFLPTSKKNNNLQLQVKTDFIYSKLIFFLSMFVIYTTPHDTGASLKYPSHNITIVYSSLLVLCVLLEDEEEKKRKKANSKF